MKKTTALILTLILLFSILSLCSCSSVTEIDGVKYELSDDRSYYILTDGTGCTASELTIPEAIKDKPVKQIGDWAFENCNTLISVSIPDSVTTMGFAVFDDCSSLTTVNLSKNANLGGDDFTGCTSLKSIVLPDSITEIGGSFDGCTSLESITLSNSLTFIGAYTFNECTSLVSLTIPASVERIATGAFEGCTALTSIELENKIGWNVESFYMYDVQAYNGYYHAISDVNFADASAVAKLFVVEYNSQKMWVCGSQVGAYEYK